MSSAGSIRDLPGSSPGGDDIYVEPDRTSAGLLILQTTPPSHPIKHSKPATLPKPATLSVQGPIKISPVPAGPPPVSAVAAEVGEKQLSTYSQEPLERSGSQCEDDYESPALFQEDLKKQQAEVSGNHYDNGLIKLY